MPSNVFGPPFDWAATGAMVQGMATLVGAGAVLIAAKMGADTFSLWRRQKVTERHMEQAERILTAAYNARRALRRTRHENSTGQPARLAVTGSGAQYMPRKSSQHRDLLRVLKAVEAGKVAPRAVADRLAAINQMIAAKDPTVSEKCVVKWWTDRGEYQFYNGVRRVVADAAIPSVGNGMDVLDIARAMMPIVEGAFANLRAGGSGEIDPVEAQAAVNREHGRPNRKL